MTYQPYPTSGASNQMAQRPSAPPSIGNAVKLMYAGAALSALGIIISIATLGSLKTAILKKFPNYTTAQVHTAEHGAVAFVVVVGLIGVGLWLWMARMNGAGKSWARIVALVLFILFTLDVLLSFVRVQDVGGLIFGLLTWLVALGATIMLWRSDSTAYINAVSAR
jgi:hypothetical protein